MKFLEKIWDTLGLYEHVEVEEEAQAETKPSQQYTARPPSPPAPPETPSWSRKAAASNSNNNNLVSLPVSNKQIKVMVVTPKVFDDAQSIADHIRAAKPVVVNFEGTEPDVMKRIIDFISGTVYALSGNIQLVGNNIMVCAPSNVDIDANKDFFAGKDFKPWKD